MSNPIPYSWLVNVSVNSSTAFAPMPVFNYCALAVVTGGVSPVPATGTWASGYNVYNNSTSFAADFASIAAAALAAVPPDYVQYQRIQWAINDVTAFFAQAANPSQLTCFSMAPQIPATNYATIFSNFSSLNNAWYGFTIADQILANAYSYVQVDVTTTVANVLIPTNTFLVTATPTTSAYHLLTPFQCGAIGTYHLIFYSNDTSTTYAAASLVGFSVAVPGTSTVTNPVAAVLNLPGYLTPTGGTVAGSAGVNVGLATLRNNNNQKKMFADFTDPSQAGDIQASSLYSSLDLTCFYNSLNLPQYGQNVNMLDENSAAAMGQYFTNLFVGGNGLGVLSSMQLADQVPDPTVNIGNIGTPNPTTPGGLTNLIGWNNNVYAAFGNGVSNIGLVQYGFQSNSNHINNQMLVYLDQIVGQDYIQFTTQLNLVSLITNSLPSGIPYSDTGIQQILNTFKASIQQAVDQGILQPFDNSNFTYPTYAQVQANNPGNIASRIYSGMVFTGNYLSRIQQISVVVNLSL